MQYFGEDRSGNCGLCDVCLSKKHPCLTESDRRRLRQEIQALLEQKSMSLKELSACIPQEQEALLKQYWEELLAEELLVSDDGLLFRWK